MAKATSGFFLECEARFAASVGFKENMNDSMSPTSLAFEELLSPDEDNDDANENNKGSKSDSRNDKPFSNLSHSYSHRGVENVSIGWLKIITVTIGVVCNGNVVGRD